MHTAEASFLLKVYGVTFWETFYLISMPPGHLSMQLGEKDYISNQVWEDFKIMQKEV